mgnify:CR=1 FL=1|tara:strand:- start:13 stop:441 length:429 start_codon:yes stop_codon:yes gene_type:complete
MAQDIPYKPVFPYTGKQIIIDSDRVTLNSKEDMTFLLAKKAISISSGGTVNIDSGGMTIINSPKIKLGLDAEHPLVHGDILYNILSEFFFQFEIAAKDLRQAEGAEGVPITKVQSAGLILKQALAKAAEELKTINSKNNFTQ